MIFTDQGAVLSACGKFRYRLWRRWDDQKPVVVFIMLNPSTADDKVLDPTLRKCIGFAERWGYGGLEIVNLFAYRTPYPLALRDAGYPVGPANEAHLRAVIRTYMHVVCAWGRNADCAEGRAAVERLHALFDQTEWLGSISALRYSKDGTPWHPLYVSYSADRLPYPRRSPEKD